MLDGESPTHCTSYYITTTAFGCARRTRRFSRDTLSLRFGLATLQPRAKWIGQSNSRENPAGSPHDSPRALITAWRELGPVSFRIARVSAKDERLMWKKRKEIVSVKRMMVHYIYIPLSVTSGSVVKLKLIASYSLSQQNLPGQRFRAWWRRKRVLFFTKQ